MAVNKSESAGITRAELALMLEKYNIGKKPLSRLLGWGETTILLYLREDGEELPDNEYTRRLKNLYTHTNGYIALLNSAQGRISTVARRRSLEAVRTLFPMTDVFAAAEYVMRLHEIDSLGLLGESMSLLRLETILFWSQVVSLCLYGKPLFEEDYCPGKSGLPYHCVEERVAAAGCILPEGLYDEAQIPDLQLEAEQLEILNYMTGVINWFGTAALMELMEAERFRLCGPKGARRRRSVSKEMLRKCYGEVFTQSKVKRLKDVEMYIQKRINYIRTHKDK